jgi:chemotaxis protein CheD
MVRHVVGVAEMKVSNDPEDVMVTHALGSCLGISVCDPVAKVGGIFHVMLPQGDVSPDKAKETPFMFVDTGTPLFFKSIFAAGGKKENLIVKVAGGAEPGDGAEEFYAIGRRNFIMLRKLFWKNKIVINGKDVGGQKTRNMILEINQGRTILQSKGKEWEL